MDALLPDLEKKLLQLNGKIETIEEIQKQQGGSFNIFSILKMERLEVQTHSAFIYELLNPNGNHYQENKYLELFIKYVLEIELNLNSVKVKQEDLTDENRRIDFTIENEENFIVIEMKIDAKDQDKQLSDYKIFADKKNKKTHVYYLTLDGKEATKNSSEGIDYKKISFSFHILKWIEKSIEKSSNLPIIRETLSQYKNLIEKITNQNNEEIEMEVSKIINSPETAKAASLLYQNLGLIWAKKEALFWDKIKKYIDNKKYNYINKIYIYTFEKNVEEIKYSDIDEITNRIKEKRSSKNAEFGIVFQIKYQEELFNNYLYLLNSSTLGFQIGEDDKETSIVNELSNKTNIKDKNGYARYKELEHQIDFFGKNNYENLSFEIFEQKNFDKIIHDISNELVSYFEKIERHLNDKNKHK